MKFNERIQLIIDTKKLSQRALADLIGLHESRISKWLKGGTKNPQRTTLQKIADVCNCSLDWLATGEGDPFPEKPTASVKKQTIHRSAVTSLKNAHGNTVLTENTTTGESGGENLPENLSPLKKNAIRTMIDLLDDDDWKWLMQRVWERIGEKE